VAPGSGEPPWSVTVPTTVPVCAKERLDKAQRISRIAMVILIKLFFG